METDDLPWRQTNTSSWAEEFAVYILVSVSSKVFRSADISIPHAAKKST